MVQHINSICNKKEAKLGHIHVAYLCEMAEINYQIVRLFMTVNNSAAIINTLFASYFLCRPQMKNSY